MSKYFAGIRPLKAGYEEFIIKPQLSGPDTVKCIVPSVKGYIRVTETKTESGFSLDAEVPENTTAVIYVPYTAGQTVKLNGSAIYTDSGFTGSGAADFVEAGGGFAVFSVKSSENNSFRFVVEG